MITRRGFVPLVLGLSVAAEAAPSRLAALPDRLAELERLNGGRLGVSVLDAGTGETAGYRAGERFPMCSTFKLLLAAAVLARVDARQEQLDRALTIPQPPLLSNSPLTEPHAGGTLSIAALCHAVLTRSDNTAANLLLERVGGPPGVTAFARSLGDHVTRLDRIELALNESRAGDPRDTTSPAAMVHDLKALLLGEVLSVSSRAQLRQWMEANLTGLDRLRARMPGTWRVADKTGTNGEHTSNDVAVVWPPGRAPFIVAAYITQCAGPESKRAALLAEIGRQVGEAAA